MEKRHFDQLVRGVRETKRHIAGKSVAGVRATRPSEPDVRAIREAATISQARFAKLIGVNLLADRVRDLALPPDEESQGGAVLLGHTKLESTVRYLGIEVDDALEMAEQTEV